MNNSQGPLISIIIATLNNKRTLQQCIDSVAKQTYPNKELIIIDGGSKDGTVNLLEENSDNFGYWISEPDRGVYNAWNKGLVQAKGDWICFIGSDDFFWNENVLDQMVAHLKNLLPSILIAYGQVMRLNAEGHVLHLDGEPWLKAKKRFKQFMSIPHPAVMHRRCLFERWGKFNESFQIAGDYELLLRELKTGNAVFFSDIIAIGVRSGGISTLPNNKIKALREIRRAQRVHGQIFPSKFFLMSMGKEYFRIFFWKVLGDRLAIKLINFRRRISGLPLYETKT